MVYLFIVSLSTCHKYTHTKKTMGPYCIIMFKHNDDDDENDDNYNNNNNNKNNKTYRLK